MSEKMGEDGELFDAFVDAMRAADETHQTLGGGTRHYVRECLLPALEERHLAVVKTEPA